MRDKLITLILLVLMALNIFDVFTDLKSGASYWHIITESIIVVLSAVGVIFLVKDIKNRSANIVRLKSELLISDDKLRNISESMRNARHEYSVVIHEQFSQWKLTPSEQDVAMLLLKGLSFREISDVRNTKEKTVRQQASVIYSKANVEGRHELAAWFLEDLMLS